MMWNEILYPYVPQPLPYEYGALQPVLSKEAMILHHDRHYKGYVDGLNAALSDYPELQKRSLRELLRNLDALPAAIRQAVREQGGGVFNHEFYFQGLRTPQNVSPEGEIGELIKRDFGSFGAFREELCRKAAAVFGSGWAWLLRDREGGLFLMETAGQDVPDLNLFTPIFAVDLWEHAYYPVYQNRRLDYVTACLNAVNWKRVWKRYGENGG